MALAIPKGKFIPDAPSNSKGQNNFTQYYREDNLLNEYRDYSIEAFRSSSFMPEVRADQVIREYGDQLDRDMEYVEQMAIRRGQSVELWRGRYLYNYSMKFWEWMRSQKRVVNEVVRVHRKTVDGEGVMKRFARNRKEALDKWRADCLEGISTEVPIKVNYFIQKQEEKLEKLTEKHRHMVLVNTCYRRYRTLNYGPTRWGYGRRRTQAIFDDLWSQLTPAEEDMIINYGNNKAMPYHKSDIVLIRQQRDRTRAMIESHTIRHAIQMEGLLKVVDITPWCRVIEKYDKEVLLILFDEKPSQKILDVIRQEKWMFSIFWRAWAKRLSDKNRESLKRILKEVK